MPEHPITPPPKLVRQWNEEAATAPIADQRYIATQAARWGADQELEACCEAISQVWQMDHVSTERDVLREVHAIRRPKPPSLVEQALNAAKDMSDCMKDGMLPNRSSLETICVALERLQQLEQESNG